MEPSSYARGGRIRSNDRPALAYRPLSADAASRSQGSQRHSASKQSRDKRRLRKHRLAHLAQYDLSQLPVSAADILGREAPMQLEPVRPLHEWVQLWQHEAHTALQRAPPLAHVAAPASVASRVVIVAALLATFVLTLFLVGSAHGRQQRRKRVVELRKLAIELVLKRQALEPHYLVLDRGSVVAVPREVADPQRGENPSTSASDGAVDDAFEKRWYARHSRHYANLHDVSLSETFVGHGRERAAGRMAVGEQIMVPPPSGLFREASSGDDKENSLPLQSPQPAEEEETMALEVKVEKVPRAPMQTRQSDGNICAGAASPTPLVELPSNTRSAPSQAVLVSPWKPRPARQRQRRHTIQLSEHLKRDDAVAPTAETVDLATYLQNRALQFCATMWQDAKVRRNADGNWWLERYGEKQSEDGSGARIRFGDKFGVDARRLEDGENQTWTEWYMEKITPSAVPGEPSVVLGHRWGRNTHNEVWEETYGVDAGGRRWAQRRDAIVQTDGSYVVVDGE
ncbi:hypothetical protein CDCA_CDCA09G2592 [Cyanidium caldarium]|uniref:Uncharacterized protein n=1 Tax=Cyanidium caldarium TaxID=2771 RepID=A0AAV9IW55_CYACA|nr:hypothetical protein CDCA_CDCA09G2592 [Cyanidium caldarium]